MCGMGFRRTTRATECMAQDPQTLNPRTTRPFTRLDLHPCHLTRERWDGQLCEEDLTVVVDVSGQQ